MFEIIGVIVCFGLGLLVTLWLLFLVYWASYYIWFYRITGAEKVKKGFRWYRQKRQIIEQYEQEIQSVKDKDI